MLYLLLALVLRYGLLLALILGAGLLLLLLHLLLLALVLGSKLLSEDLMQLLLGTLAAPEDFRCCSTGGGLAGRLHRHRLARTLLRLVEELLEMVDHLLLLLLPRLADTLRLDGGSGLPGLLLNARDGLEERASVQRLLRASLRLAELILTQMRGQTAVGDPGLVLKR